MINVPNPPDPSFPPPLTTVEAVAREVGAVLVTTGLVWTVLLSVFRSWLRERIYAILSSDAEKHGKFVLDIITTEEHRTELGTCILDTIASEHHRDRFRAIVGEVYRDELQQLRDMKHAITELGARTGELVVNVSTMQEMTQDFAKAQAESSKTTAVLAQSLQSMSESMTYFREEMGKLGTKIDRTQEILLTRVNVPGRGRGPQG